MTSHVHAERGGARVETRLVEVDDGVRLSVSTCGEGPPVLLLHGFPQCAYAWREQLPALAAAGFRAIAPDMRGYDRSDKPSSVSAYRLTRLVADVRNLVRELGYDRVHLVGHDWGGAVAWAVAAEHPEIVDKLVILNAPHPDVMVRELRRSAQQRKSSWYMFFFQLPLLPERALTREGSLARLFQRTAVAEGAVRAEDIVYYAEAIRRPGAARGMVNYYRAAGRELFRARKRTPRITRPTLVLWGMKDTVLGPSLLDGLEAHVERLSIVPFPEASHWIVEEQGEAVTRELVRFFAAPSG